MPLCKHKGGAGLACSLSDNTRLVYSCSSGVEMLDSHQQSPQDQPHDESLCPQCQMAQNPQGDPRKVGGSGRGLNRGGWSGPGTEMKTNSTSSTGQSFGSAHTHGERDASARKGPIDHHALHGHIGRCSARVNGLPLQTAPALLTLMHVKFCIDKCCRRGMLHVDGCRR